MNLLLLFGFFTVNVCLTSTKLYAFGRKISAGEKFDLLTSEWCSKLTEDVTRHVYIHPSVTLKDFKSGGTGVYATGNINPDTVLPTWLYLAEQYPQ